MKMKLWDHTIRNTNKVFDFDEYQQTMVSVPSWVTGNLRLRSGTSAELSTP